MEKRIPLIVALDGIQQRSYTGLRICPECGHEVQTTDRLTITPRGIVKHSGECPKRPTGVCQCPMCAPDLYDDDYRPVEQE